jgi:hypothetical protein
MSSSPSAPPDPDGHSQHAQVHYAQEVNGVAIGNISTRGHAAPHVAQPTASDSASVRSSLASFDAQLQIREILSLAIDHWDTQDFDPCTRQNKPRISAAERRELTTKYQPALAMLTRLQPLIDEARRTAAEHEPVHEQHKKAGHYNDPDRIDYGGGGGWHSEPIATLQRARDDARTALLRALDGAVSE